MPINKLKTLKKKKVSLKQRKTNKKCIVKKDVTPVPKVKESILLSTKERCGNGIGTIFDIQSPDDPLCGAPKDVQKQLDGMALYLQKNPHDEEIFLKIVAYIHKYLLGLVFKKFSFIRGYEGSDMYQEALIALSQKAIPKFKPNKNMSFLNFAKMCITRHLITILHASLNRKKDFPINKSISLNYNPVENNDGDENGSCTLSNIITDEAHTKTPYHETSEHESYSWTIMMIRSKLSEFENVVLDEYLKDKSYKEMAKSITRITGVRFNEKSIDNALLRIRKKALVVLKNDKRGELLFLKERK
jgi:RNA polymerase sporulation-specific sigma factor